MKIHLVTFYNSKYADVFKVGLERLKSTYTLGGIDTFTVYTENDLTFSEKEYKFLHSHEKGFGYWAWKPVAILQKIQEISDNDVVLYHDCGREAYNFKFTGNIRPLVNHIYTEFNGIGIPFSYYKHYEYTKKECFEVMECNSDFYLNSFHASATWHVWTKINLSMEILDKWRYWNFHFSNIITDINASKEINGPGYHGHRHDQSILTNLILKYSKSHSGLVKPMYQPAFFWEKDINKWVDNISN